MIRRAVIVLLALASALMPLPSTAVERWYSAGFYPWLQAVVTSLTNRVPIALLDVSVGCLILAVVVVFVRTRRRAGTGAAVAGTLISLVTTGAVLYIVFLGVWGLNYRRVPLERKIDYDVARVTRAQAVALATQAVARVNGGYAEAHATAPATADHERAFGEVLRALGAPRVAVTGVPKASLLSFYFRRAAIDGMTDPFFLEVILNPDLLPVERPFVLAHEWAHLAGYAVESEANFIGWLTCLRSDRRAQYSGWLMAYGHTAGVLGRDDLRSLPALDAGPRSDLRAMTARYARSSPVVRTAAREVYDRYLRANRVAEGIGSYGAVVRLMLGTRFEDGWKPIRVGAIK